MHSRPAVVMWPCLISAAVLILGMMACSARQTSVPDARQATGPAADAGVAEPRRRPAAEQVPTPQAPAAVVPGRPALVPAAVHAPRPPTVRPGEREVIAAQEQPIGNGGRVSRVRLVRREGAKYPLVRIEEQLERDAKGERVTHVREMVADHLLVTVRDEHQRAQLGRTLPPGCAVRRAVPGSPVVLVSIPAASHADFPVAIARLGGVAGVAAAEPDFLVRVNITPDDPSFPQQWALNNLGQDSGTVDADIDAPEAWALHTGSRTVKVGIIDTGMDLQHPDLVANLWTNPGETGLDAQGHDKATNGIDDDGDGFIDDVHGWNFVSDNNHPQDDHFHGTHVAGTIGAGSGNGLGVAGVCWQVSLVPLKFLDANGSGYTSDAVAAIYYASRIGCDLTSNSWGGGGFDQALKDAIDAAGAQGRLFVAAAGNDSSNNDTTPSYPATYACPNIIAVAASDRNDARASFSNIGQASVHIAAPGKDILNTLPTVTTPAMTSYGLSAGYGSISGTSMATPHVSGACALLKAYDPTLGAVALKDRILATVDLLPAWDAYVQSGGRLNLDRALRNQRAPHIIAAITSPPASAGLMATSIQVLGTADATMGFTRFVLEAGRGSAPTSWSDAGFVLPGGGTSPIREGLLGTWTVPSPADGPWTIRLTATAASGSRTSLRTVTVDPFLKPGFPTYAYFGGGTYRSGNVGVLVADIAGDPKSEILATGLCNGPLYAVDAFGQHVAGWPADGGFAAYPAAGDVNGDGRAEVAVSFFDNVPWGLLGGDGHWLPNWPQPMSNYGSSPPVIADVDGDGIPEILSGQEDWQVHINRLDGTLLPGWPRFANSGGQRIENITVADIDGDGVNEVLALGSWTSMGHQLFAWHADGTPLPGWPVQMGDGYGYNLGLVVGDIDGDGQKEIISTRNGQVVALRADGSSVPGWPVDIGGGDRPRLTAPILADVDGDGRPEVVFADTKQLWILRGDGHPLSGWPVSAPGYSGIAWGDNWQPVVGDIDGDDQVEIIMGYSAPSILCAYRKDGSMLPGWPRTYPLGPGMAPAIADIDGDGRNDLIVGSGEGSGTVPHIYAWDFNPPGARSNRIEWGQMGGGPSRNAVWPQPQTSVHAPRARMAVSPGRGIPGEPITFDGSASYDPDAGGGIISWHWDFGDGTSGDGAVVSHAYALKGRFAAHLTVTDAEGLSAQAANAVIINHPPVPLLHAISTLEDTPCAAALAASDADGDALTFSIVSQPTKGYLSGNTYWPHLNANGNDSFTYRIDDGMASATATVAIVITPVNDPPVVTNLSAITTPGAAVAVTLVAQDPDSSNLSYAINSPAHGVLSGTAPRLTYTPSPGFTGNEVFTYTASDGELTSTPATVSVFVNSPPVPTLLAVTTQEDTACPMVLSASDVDGDALSYSWWTYPTRGTLSGTAPNLTYTPALNWNGSDSFSYRISDGVNTVIGTVAITITPVNDAPVASSVSVFTNIGTAVTVTLKATDVDSTVLSYRIVDAPANGSLSGTAPSLTYMPNPGFAGTDTFTYTASDGSLTSAMATATMRVNRPPVAQPMNVTVRNNTITPITLMATDADGQALTYRVTVNPTRGMLSGTAPNLNYLRTGNPGADNLTFVANDGYCDSAPATVTLNLVDINPWPEADLSTVPTAGTVSFTLFGNGFGVSGSGGLDALADAGHFTWTDLPEDGRLSARVTGLGNAGTTARGGLMVRAGNATDSPMAGLLLTSTGHLEWRQRTASAVPAISTDLGAQTLPCWLRLARTADGVEASRSTDGRTWTVVASAAVVLPATARAGLWAGSGTAGLARLDADQVCVHHTHATEWPTLGASASRSGFRSGGFAGTPFTQTWSIATGSKLNPACVGNGLVFVTSNIYFASGWLKAYDASTGALVWTQAFASPYVINPPAFAEGRVFVQWCNASSGQFSGFSAITGMPLWQSPYATQFGRYAAACPADGAVFVNGGAYGGMYGFEQAGGTQRFFSSLAQYDQWAPAFADGALYSWVGGVLRAHTPATGALTWSVDCNAPVTGGSINSVPVIAEGCAVLRSNGVLCAVDLATRIKRWSVNIPTTYNVYNVPAVDQGTVFALTGNQLKSYSLASGSPLLSFTATAPLIDQPLVTADSVIVTSANAAWILDRSTFAVRQSLSAGGHATLSGRTLHLADDAGNLRAFTAPVATPTITPDGGAFTTPQQVAITDATCDAVIRYTLDGSAPTRTATPYGTPITIASGTTVLKAAAFTTTAQSPIATATFTVNTAPTVALAAAATPDPVTGTTAMLTILGADDAGEVPLTYTWEAVDAPPAAVTFNANGTNAAKSTMAGFILPGGYSFQCTIRDAGGLAVTSRVTVLVARTPTTVVVSPAVATLRTSQVQPFTATVQDQFGTLMDPPPAIAWSPASLPGGTLDATGLFTANTSPGGPYTLTATVGGASGTATVTVLLPDTLPVITAQPANLTVAVGQTATFLVVATGNPAPAYQWQRSNDGGSNWSDIVGATTASCTTPVLALADDLARFRCTVANTVGSVTCNAAVLNVVNAGITREYWTGITGTAVSAIPLASIPAGIQLLTSFEAPTSFADNYGARVRGCLCPTVSGAYQFWIASDDNSELWLSTTASSANKVRIAYLSGWASARQWTKYTTQASAAINLVAGQRYYIEALHKEGGGGDSLAVAWQCTAAGITQQVIPGAVLMPYGTLPSVTSGAVSGITATAAVVAGTVTADGGTAVYRGVCYGTVANPTITGGKVACGTGAGVFSATLTGLVQGTVHYARAYATNGAGTVYGGQVAFTTAVPPAISLHPVGQTAVVGSTATFTVTATGSPAPTYQWYRSNDQGTNWSVITGATGASYTTAALVITDDYAQFRCTAANSGGTTTSNGAVLNVINAGITREYWTGVAGSTVATVPVATTPSGIQLLTSCEGPTSFADNYGTRVRGYLVPTVSGSYRFWIASDDSSELWLSTDATTTNKARIAYVNGYSSSRQWTKFATQASVAITLVAGQSYYLEALHKEGGGGDNLAVAWQCTAAGIAQQVIPGVVLRPVGIQPRVATGSVASIAVASASVAGNVLADGGSTVLRGICYGLAPNPTITGSKVAGGNGVGTFTATLNGLSAGTLYHVRAYATNAAGTVYGADATFTTLADTVPTVTTSVAAHITDSTADCGGTITVSSGLAVTERGVCWSLVPTPTIAGSRTIDGSGTGAFTSVMTGLEANTTYYVRAYATNAIGTGYGEQVTFTTLVPEPPVPTVIGQVRTWDDDRLTPGDPKPGTWAGQRIAHLVPSTFDHIIARGQVFTRDDDRTAQ